MDSWVPVPDGSDFPVTNLPYGVFAGLLGRPGSASPSVITCSTCRPWTSRTGPTSPSRPSTRSSPAAGRRGTRCGPPHRPAHRSGYRLDVRAHLHPRSAVRMLMPFDVADYVDFYASEHHASNVGRIFRPGGDPLTPNWRHLPIGYHGRAGTVVVSGTPVRRPCGQHRARPHAPPVFGPVAAPRHRGGSGIRRRRPRPRRSSIHGGLRRARLRCGACQRLECARSAGVGVRAARPVPRQVVRDLHLAVGGAAGRASAGPRAVAAAASAATAVPSRDRSVGSGSDVDGAVERNHRGPAAVRADVLDAGPAAGPPHRQRCVAAYR